IRTDGLRGEIPPDDPVTDQPARYACPRPQAGATGDTTLQKLAVVDAASLNSDVPEFRAGDTRDVDVKVIEGSRSRIQVCRGIVIRRQGDGVRETFTVRKISVGVGVERTFPVHSPNVDKIEVLARGDVRRA